jgi:hypothetical protein
MRGPEAERAVAGGPAVSVVLPVRDGGRFLADAIDSVRVQTFASFELLVIDDGSTDDSVSLARARAREDARIRVLSGRPRGIAHALNDGLRAARGRYVARLDADDLCAPQRLERQIAFLEAHDECVAVGSAVEVIDEEGETLAVSRFPAGHVDIVQGLLAGAACAFAHPSVMMKREAALAAGAYRPDLFPSEDLDLWLRLMERGELANLGEPLVRYRRHPGTVGARECRRQMATTAALVNAARARRGLAPIAVPAAFGHASAAATYHFECVRLALASGNRAAVRRHAGACVRHAPTWWRSYAALACSWLLPRQAMASAVRGYRGLRAWRRATISAT